MASKEIPDLTAASTLTGTEEVHVVQSGNSRRTTAQDIANLITQYTDEMARDAVGAALTNGAGITITINDGANTITIATTITQYTDEMAQDAVGAMVGTSIVYGDAGATLKRAALTGAITAAIDDNATSLGSFTKSELDGAVSDGNVLYTGDLIGTPFILIVAVSDETTALTTGTAKITFRMPAKVTLSSVRASVATAPTGSTIIVDIKETGTTIFSTKLSIDASEKTSTTAASAAVLSDTSLADDAEITVNIDQIGSTIAGAGLKLTFIGTYAA